MSATTRREFLRWTAVGSVAGALPLTTGFGCLGPDRVQPEGARSTFLEAARAGNTPVVRKLLAADPGLIAARDESGRSAFALAHLEGHGETGAAILEAGHEPDAHEAALAGDWDLFRTRIEERPEVVDRDHPIGGTAMYAAAAGGAGSSIWRVYAACGHPSLVPPGAGRVSPLQAALRYRHLPVAEMTAATLLSNAADPNPPVDGDDPPLTVAAERGSLALVEFLIRRGARIDAEDRRGRTALEAARQAGQAHVAALLRNHAKIPRTHSSSRTAYDVHGNPYRRPADLEALPLAARRDLVGKAHGDLEAVRAAVERDPRFAHSVATTSEISVEACAHTGRLSVVDYLLEHGAPYSLPTATVRGDRKAMIRLLDQDPKRIHERGAHDFALLWYPLIGRCDPSITELLLQRGAEVERQDWLGTTALHFASIRGPLEAVELLVQHGADVNRVGRKFGAEGQTPLQLAEKHKNAEIAAFLRSKGATA